MGKMRRRYGFGWTRGVTILIVVNVAFWLLELLAFSGGATAGSSPLALVMHGLMLDPEAALGRLQIWQLFTYMFLHDPHDPLHLFFNMFVLYMFGGLFERRWGTRVFLRFYLISGLIAGLVGALAGLIAPGLLGGTIVGASGSLTALLMAFALIFPEQQVQLMFVMPIRGRQLVLALVALDLLMFLTGSHIAIAVHAGGLLAGWLLITGSWRWSRLRRLVARSRGPHAQRRGRFKVYSNTRH